MESGHGGPETISVPISSQEGKKAAAKQEEAAGC
jgi:hypothetical protein